MWVLISERVHLAAALALLGLCVPACGVAVGPASQLPKVAYVYRREGWVAAPEPEVRCLRAIAAASPSWDVHALDKRTVQDLLPRRTTGTAPHRTGGGTSTGSASENLLVQLDVLWVGRSLCACKLPVPRPCLKRCLDAPCTELHPTCAPFHPLWLCQLCQLPVS